MRLPLLFRASLLLALLTSNAWAQGLTPYVADYELFRGGTRLGHAQVRLQDGEQPDCFTYSYIARPSWLFRWATGSITESSQFCVQDKRLLPSRYRYHRSGIGADKENFSLDFDAERRLVTDHQGVERDWPPGAVDRLMVQLEALRLVEGMGFPVQERRLNVTIVDDDRIKDYTLAVIKAETIKVPAGEFETIRVERINDPNKTTRFWVAPALNNLIVKVEQQRKNDPAIGIALQSRPDIKAATPEPAAAEPAPTPPRP